MVKHRRAPRDRCPVSDTIAYFTRELPSRILAHRHRRRAASAVGDAIVVSFAHAVPDFDLPPNPERVLENVLRLNPCSGRYCPALYAGVEQPVSNEELPFDPSDLKERGGQFVLARISGIPSLGCWAPPKVPLYPLRISPDAKI